MRFRSALIFERRPHRVAAALFWIALAAPLSHSPAEAAQDVAQESSRVEVAKRDWSAQRPLPGLPDLGRPVFLSEGALLCESRGALANPNTQIVVMTGACTVAPRAVRVSVFLPRGAEDYVESHVFGIVAISLRSGQMSDATVYRAWVKISSLRN